MLFRKLTVSAVIGMAVAQDLTTILANTPELSNLTSYLALFPDLTAKLASLQNITVLAPNNNAFARLAHSSAGAALVQNDTSAIQALLTYHVLDGTHTDFSDKQFVPTLLQPPQFTNVTGGQVVEATSTKNQTAFVSGLLNNASVSSGPVNFTGGVVHIIDDVLTVPQSISDTAAQLDLSAATGALTSANLVTTVDTLSDVTLFVPNNEAFEAIGSALPNLTTQGLSSILQYHLVQGVVGYSPLLQNGTVKTVQGKDVTITIEDGEVFVNSARVVVPDVLVANGVVHVIDNVLNPNNTTARPNPSQVSGSPAFSDVSSASNIPFTSGVPTPTSTSANQSATGARATSSSSSGAAAPANTGAMGAAALVGGAFLVLNM
ncbi:uncharacterized protein Z520_08213 [Fonsecaea multimorphosa CBS 102226]|uniref:FAS1 domain-containing protein n=1 Tax=Fonsecaea multimorphosa CBS 102226 TaxID=1442371 RepID=A0A0D2KH45_9EURO|nr:uncharacterized protein Z520_08213 [Fonsecaea multimorphosa CBS 102226]KIX95958.1 hypothetical protein Z520_08213 [Fonsecaea multimorphosa CBS 102226]OAL21729.1 hypothetical protein AYO22_07671 [Fonsecaea multimorphosa]